jgi:hypothetical protein
MQIVVCTGPRRDKISAKTFVGLDRTTSGAARRDYRRLSGAWALGWGAMGRDRARRPGTSRPGPQCVSRSGQCQTVADCPAFDRRILAIADRSRDPSFGLCRFSPKPAPPAAYLWGHSGIGSLSVTQPQPGDGFLTTDDTETEFVWQQTDRPVLLFVLKSLP